MAVQQCTNVPLLGCCRADWNLHLHSTDSFATQRGVQVLHLLLHKLTTHPYDDMLLKFMFVDEHLVDIGDDLVDYEVIQICAGNLLSAFAKE